MASCVCYCEREHPDPFLFYILGQSGESSHAMGIPGKVTQQHPG